MRLIGIDCAPGKGSTVFERGAIPEFRDHLAPAELRDLVLSSDDALVCWDSPLTGPMQPDEITDHKGRYTQRPIEAFFKSKDYRFDVNPVKGISVQGYAGCQHWTLSRALLGLPRVGPFDRPDEDLPFSLCFGRPVPGEGPWIVEVHPGLALWLWCREHDHDDWRYKKDKTIHEALVSCLIQRWPSTEVSPPNAEDLTDDDRLDAFIAWSLGALWLQDESGVEVLGDAEHGSFLLPVNAELRGDWQKFCDS